MAISILVIQVEMIRTRLLVLISVTLDCKEVSSATTVHTSGATSLKAFVPTRCKLDLFAEPEGGGLNTNQGQHFFKREGTETTIAARLHSCFGLQPFD
jgi:hypothetical protein